MPIPILRAFVIVCFTTNLKIKITEQEDCYEIELYKETFEQEVLQSDIPVLVDFWATWCGPCKMIAPIVKEIADEYDGKILVGKVNVDEEPDLTMQYNVSSIPTLMVFKNGQLVNKAVGYREKDEILKMLK